MDEEEEVQRPYQVGDRVALPDEDLGLIGTVIDVDLAGQITVAWDDWYTHPDQVTLEQAAPPAAVSFPLGKCAIKGCPEPATVGYDCGGMGVIYVCPGHDWNGDPDDPSYIRSAVRS